MTAAHEQQPFTVAHVAEMATVATIWGSSFLLIAVSTSQFAPPLVALLRLAFGVGVLGLVPSARRPVDRAAWPAIIALGIVWMAGPFVLFAAGLGSAFRGDHLTPWLAGGVPLILLGAYGATRTRTHRQVGDLGHAEALTTEATCHRSVQP
jgi:drug/metabolite transporter (DMT)-like permease